MVEIKEVTDEHFEMGQPGPDDDDEYSDTDSEISTESDEDVANESLGDRLYALRDMIPPSTRSWIYNSASSTASMAGKGAWVAGRALWATLATTLLIGVPFTILVMDDMQQTALEQEFRMREMGAEVLTGGQGAGGEQQSTADRVGAALNAERSMSEPKSAL